MRKLEDITAWQWELAIIASRFRLGLLNDDEIIAFTHKLMNEGYYDDVMLEIIDHDPLFDFKENGFIKEKFKLLLQNLELRLPSQESAKRLLIFYTHFSFSVRPHNFHYSYIDRFDFYSFTNHLYSYDEIDTQIFKETSNIEIAYREVEELYNDFDRIGIEKNPLTDIDIVCATKNLYQECENWLNGNQPKILEIMHQLFP